MLITSRQNPLVRHIRRLGADAAYRREQGQYLADGRKLLTEALRSGAVPKLVAVADGVSAPRLPDVTGVITVPAALMEAISPLESPQGILFACAIPAPPPAPPDNGRWLYLDRLQDPGNIGSILRTAEAFAINGVLLSPGCADPFGPKTIRAAMGAAFRIPTGIVSRETLLAGPLPFIVADMDENAVSAGEAVVENCIIALGNEGQGIDPELKNRADAVISIPMPGRAQSLGVAAAAAILCWEMSKSR
jgi:TrmH family RNA methyltransferase